MPLSPPQRRFGIGWRPVHAAELKQVDAGRIDWLEILSENIMGFGGRPRRMVEALRADYPMACHGVSLSIGSTDPLDPSYLKALKDLCLWLQPELVSDHLAWTSWRGKQSYDLLPLPRTRECLQHLCERIDGVQNFLQRTLVIENPSSYLDFRGADYDEVDFLAELCHRTGCQLLLDLNNCRVNQKNLGWDPWAYLERLRPEWVRQLHLAGHQEGHGLTVDTHDCQVAPEVWELFRGACQRFPKADLVIEWDEHIPPLETLLVELDRARLESQQLPSQQTLGPKLGQSLGHSSLPLTQLQKHFFDIVTDNAKPETLPTLLQESPSAETALRYYRAAYGTRMLDLLEKMYPLLAQHLGSQNFAQLMRLFVESRTVDPYSIDAIGKGLSEFLQTASVQLVPLANRDYLAELARWEDFQFHFPLAADDSRSPLTLAELVSWTEDQWNTGCFQRHGSVSLWQSVWNFAEDPLNPAASAALVCWLFDRSTGDLKREALSSTDVEIWQGLDRGLSLQDLCQTQGFERGGFPEIFAFLSHHIKLGRIVASFPSLQESTHG